MLLHILSSIILPLFLLIGLGALLDRRLKLDLPTLSRLNYYVFVPALSFAKLLDADISAGAMGKVALFSVAHTAVLLALAAALFSARPLRKHRATLTLGTLFFNAGNYGIPLVVLAFGSSMVSVLATVLVVQNFLTFTLGIWLLQRHLKGGRQVWAGVAGAPVVWAVALALAVKGLHLPLPAQVRDPIGYLSDGLVPVALLTLGVQLSRTRLTHGIGPLSAVTAMRLLVSPLAAAGLAALFGFAGPVAAVLIISAGFPVAVNVYILSSECGQDGELASQAIFLTTLLSAATVAALLAFLH